MPGLFDTVLLADDDADSNAAVRTALLGAGFRVVQLDRPASLVHTMDRHVPAVVVLDPTSFTGRGWQLLAELRRDARYVPIPVIALMRAGMETERVRAFEQGAQQCAAKPLDPAEAVARVRSVVERRRQIARLFESEERAMRRIPASKGAMRVPLVIDDVMSFESGNKSVYAHTADGSYLVELTLAELEEAFGSDEFMRVHRSHLVHVPHVAGITRSASGLKVVLQHEGARLEVPVARRHIRDVHDRFHL